MKDEGHKENIVKVVQEYESKGGITKNQVVTILTSEYGGGRSTYWKYFGILIKEQHIELKRYKKKQERLFPTDSKKQIQEFEDKIKSVNKLLKLLEQYPDVGDCVILGENDGIPKLTPYHLKEIKRKKRVIGYTVDFDRIVNPSEHYCLQARYDILKNIPIFLVNYVNDPLNKFSKKTITESMEIINPIMVDCIYKVQKEYSKSIYYSNKFLEKHKNNTKISLIKGLPNEDISTEFLRILGRYYFLISSNLSNFKIDSTKEQKTISEFVTLFYSKSEIPNDKLSEGLNRELIIEYWLDSHKPKKRFYKPGMLERLDKIHEGLGGKFAYKFDRDANNDPFVIASFYNEWIFRLGVFSNLEKRIIQTYLDETEKYEIESKSMAHNDPLQEEYEDDT